MQIKLMHNFASEHAEARGDVHPTLPIMAVLLDGGLVETVYEARDPEHARRLVKADYGAAFGGMFEMVDARGDLF